MTDRVLGGGIKLQGCDVAYVGCMVCEEKIHTLCRVHSFAERPAPFKEVRTNKPKSIQLKQLNWAVTVVKFSRTAAAS